MNLTGSSVRSQWRGEPYRAARVNVAFAVVVTPSHMYPDAVTFVTVAAYMPVRVPVLRFKGALVVHFASAIPWLSLAPVVRLTVSGPVMDRVTAAPVTGPVSVTTRARNTTASP